MSLIDTLVEYKMLVGKGIFLIGLALCVLAGVITSQQAAAILSIVIAADTYYEYKLSERIGWLEVELE
jgi:hypothetical protein